MSAPAICEKGGGGLVFPATDAEYEWPNFVRALLYGMGLVYFFLGVAIVADVFMGAIEKVTSKRVQSKDKEGRIRTGKLWNETVATLTLMALGSSAPEIFLSVIDIAKKRFHFGELGPSTIVGSAAFNLFVIVGVCVFAIPTGEVRKIANRPAFYITAAFSLFAYMWMAAVLTQISPNIVEPWEAFITLGMLPVMIFVSFKFDRGDADAIVDFVSRRFGSPDMLDLDSSSEDDPIMGTFKFECDRLLLRGNEQNKTISVGVVRSKDVPESSYSVQYRTEGISAVAGLDFVEAEGSLEFKPGEMIKYIEVEIIAKPTWRAPCNFLVILSEPDPGMMLDPEDDGGEEETYLTITVDMLPNLTSLAGWTTFDRIVNINSYKKGFEDWWDQILHIPYVNGSPEEQAEASTSDWVMHFISFPWKLLFGILPPTTFAGGWVAFFISLFAIAAVTACISDLAELFGCVISLPDIVTAFTFVALGTSMPDLFASLTAAKEDPTADASIVNVTGSNSVNVYLGLGLPWSIAAMYWKLNGRTPEWESKYPEEAAKIDGAAFVVQSKNMGFSVLTFCVICCIALVLLHLRRKWLGGELGGSLPSKVNTLACFVLMWAGWVGLCSWRILRFKDEWGNEPMIVQGLALFLLVGGFGLSFLHMKLVSVRFRRERELKLAAQLQARKSCRNSRQEGGSGDDTLSETKVEAAVQHNVA